MRPVTELFVKSSITEVPGASAGRRARRRSRGFAFSGAPDVAKVEVTRRRRRDVAAGGARSRSTTPRPGGSGRSGGRRRCPGKAHALGARDRQPRRRPAEGGGLEPERLPPQRLALGGRRGDGVRPPRAVAAAALVAPRRRGAASRPRAAAPKRSQQEGDGEGREPVPPTSTRSSRSSARGSRELPPGPGKAVADRGCLTCHSADMVAQQRLTEKQWTAEVTKMVGLGRRRPRGPAGRARRLPREELRPRRAKFEPVVTRPVGRRRPVTRLPRSRRLGFSRTCARAATVLSRARTRARARRSRCARRGRRGRRSTRAIASGDDPLRVVRVRHGLAVRRGVDRRREDRVDRDVLLDELRRHRVGQLEDRPLRGGVGGDVLARALRGAARDVDDRAARPGGASAGRPRGTRAPRS